MFGMVVSGGIAVGRWRASLIVAAVGWSAGCGLIPKGNTAATTRPPLGDRATGDLTRGRGNANGVLAGQVIDLANQRRPGTSLTVQPLDGGQAVNAVTNDQGYFTINGLEPGKKYKIVARAKSGESQSVGSAEVTAPNVVVMIKLSDRPDVEAKPTGLAGGVGVGGVHSSIAGSDDTLVRNPSASGRGDRLGPVAGATQPPPAGASSIHPRLGRPAAEQPANNAVPEKPEYITQELGAGRGVEPRVDPPRGLTLDIQGPSGRSGRPENSAPAEPATPSPFLELPLADLDLRPTSLAAYRGRLTLVDVWNTGCIPCIQAMPELMKLQRTYGPRGLVVVGIAARETGTPESVAATIRWRGKAVDYPLLMEQEGKSVLAAFNVQSFPTLILLDENGREVWRGVGLSAGTKRQLEAELQKRLQ